MKTAAKILAAVAAVVTTSCVRDGVYDSDTTRQAAGDVLQIVREAKDTVDYVRDEK